jgi:hypothetical protein
VHFCLHDAFEIGHGAVELALAGLDADDRMRRAAELDARPRPAPRRLVEAVMPTRSSAIRSSMTRITVGC